MESVRLDKWLWAARFFKTRSLTADAIAGGKVHVNGARVKPARGVALGDEVAVRRGPFEIVATVRGLSERRGPASEAEALYEETPESAARREAVRNEMRLQTELVSDGRPTKKDRRDLRRLKRR